MDSSSVPVPVLAPVPVPVPVPVPISEIIKAASFWKEHSTSLPLVEEIAEFLKMVDPKVYPSVEVVVVLLAALREHMRTIVPVKFVSLEEYEGLVKAIQSILTEAVSDIVVDVKEVVVAVQDSVHELRAAESVTDTAVAASNVVEAVVEATAKVADEVQDAAKKVAEVTNMAEKAAIAVGLDEKAVKTVKEVADKVKVVAETLADAADKVEDVAKKIDEAIDAAQAMAPVVEQKCCLFLGWFGRSCKKAPKA